MSLEPRDDRSLRVETPTRELTLKYPLAWFTPSSEGPILRALGGPDFARFGAWPGSPCQRREATAARFLALWVVLGDSGESGPMLTAIRADETPRDLSPELRAWWEISRRMRAAMGPAWCERLGASFDEWLAASRAEARISRRISTGGPYPRREEILPVRGVAGGARVALDLLEYLLAAPLPHIVRSHPAYEAVGRYLAQLLAIQCDLEGATRDLAAARPNLMIAALLGEGLSGSAACAELRSLHDVTVCGLGGAAQWLRAEFSRCGELDLWLRGVQEIGHGFPRWCAQHELANWRLPGAGIWRLEIDYV